MVAIGNNFFYTRTLPCTLWFFDRNKELDDQKKDKVLMLDARKIFRKVTSKVNDFSPEQMQNLICIVNLYRGNTLKFDATLKEYLQRATELAHETSDAILDLHQILTKTEHVIRIFFEKLKAENKSASSIIEDILNSNTDTLNVYGDQIKLRVDAQNVTADINELENVAQQCNKYVNLRINLLKIYLTLLP